MITDNAFYDPYRPPVEVLERTPLEIFLHVNRDLNDFQREAIKLVLEDDRGPDDYVAAIELLDKKVRQLQDAGWKPERPEGDMVLRPRHYDRFPIEPTFFIIENGIDWLRGNYLKYVCRYPFKNGVEDLKKAMRNIAMLVRYLDNDPSWSR